VFESPGDGYSTSSIKRRLVRGWNRASSPCPASNISNGAFSSIAGGCIEIRSIW